MGLTGKAHDVKAVFEARDLMARNHPELVKSFEEFQRSYRKYLEIADRSRRRSMSGRAPTPTARRWR